MAKTHSFVVTGPATVVAMAVTEARKVRGLLFTKLLHKAACQPEHAYHNGEKIFVAARPRLHKP